MGGGTRLGLLALAVLAGCGGDVPLRGPRELPTGIPDEGSLLRLPAEGGVAQLYQARSLTPLDWEMRGRMAPIVRALGTDLDDRMVYAVDAEGEVIGLDLLARRERTYLTDVRRITGTADGSVLAIDSTGRPVIFRGRTATVLKGDRVPGNDARLVRAPGLSPGLAAYTAAGQRLEVRNEDGIVRSFRVPAGELASSWFGDVQVITTDSGLVVVHPSDETPPEFIRLKGMPITSAFSPSAHRLYVARARGDLVFLDRFGWNELATLALPGSAKELRPDRSGRWLLARPTAGDSLWLIDLVRQERVATIQAPWAEDLPLVSGGRTLVVRSGEDIVAWDIMSSPPTARTRLAGAAKDRFLQLPWVPASGTAPIGDTPDLADTPAATDSAGTLASDEGADDAATSPDSTAAAAAERVFIQVSSSQNMEYARAFARQLTEIGFRAKVLDPKAPGEGFRVVVGPYPTREAADADGRRLGRPYFVTTPGSGEP
ncbi:MAG TPA: SPOR domain-containing protein [Gemmatimonadales bacterium]|nr:SPOR domain-containing protein [Gemmatimonadales bacterium]